MKKPNQSKELKKQFYIIKNKYGCTVWHCATIGCNLEVMKALWISSKGDELNTDEIFVTQTGDGSNAFRMAGQNNHIEPLRKLWIWAEERQINPKGLKKLVLSTDKNGHIAWHIAAQAASFDTLEALWICCKEAEINTEKLLLAETGKLYTVLHLAATNNLIETKLTGLGLKKRK